jgi:hemerythrin
MTKFEWNTSFETGIRIIDEQHKELFKYLDELTLGVYQGRGKDQIRIMIDFLEKYTEEHFTTEESMFRRTGYAGISKHIEAHNIFRTNLKNFREDFRKGRENYLAIHLEKNLKNWWETHILKTDMEYVPYLNGTR